MNIKNAYTTQKYIFLTIIGFLVSFNISAQKAKKQNTSGFLDFNTYYDTREFNVMTINILSNLPNRWQYFSLTNYQSSNKSLDFSNFYSEQNLRWKIKEKSPLDFSFQYVMRQGLSNDDLRLGIRWRIHDTPKLSALFKKLKMTYSINPMLIQLRVNAHTKSMTQIEHVYKINLYQDMVYLGGFADQNFIYANNKIAFKWVSEHQLGIRMIDQLYVVAEYRVNDFLTSDNTGLGIGIEYKILF